MANIEAIKDAIYGIVDGHEWEWDEANKAIVLAAIDELAALRERWAQAVPLLNEILLMTAACPGCADERYPHDADCEVVLMRKLLESAGEPQ